MDSRGPACAVLCRASLPGVLALGAVGSLTPGVCVVHNSEQAGFHHPRVSAGAEAARDQGPESSPEVTQASWLLETSQSASVCSRAGGGDPAVLKRSAQGPWTQGPWYSGASVCRLLASGLDVILWQKA